MLTKIIRYTNPFTNKEEIVEHHFHISKADLVEMDIEEHQNRYEKDGVVLTGFQAKMQRIVDAEDGKAIMTAVKDLIRRSYGKREGNSFRKSDAIWEEFAGTEAYSQLIWDLCVDAEASAAFMNGIIPSDLDKAAEEFSARVANITESSAIAAVEQVADATGGTFPKADPTGLTNSTTPQVITRDQAAAMDSDELSTGLASGKYKFE